MTKKIGRAVDQGHQANTRRKYSSEEKIRIVLESMLSEISIAELCRREGIAQNLYYRRSKGILESGKRRLDEDTKRESNTSEGQSL